MIILSPDLCDKITVVILNVEVKIPPPRQLLKETCKRNNVFVIVENIVIISRSFLKLMFLKIYTTLGYIASHTADDAKAKHVSQVQEDL